MVFAWPLWISNMMSAQERTFMNITITLRYNLKENNSILCFVATVYLIYLFTDQLLFPQLCFTIFLNLESLFKIWCLGFRTYFKQSIHKFELLLAIGSTLHIIPYLYLSGFAYFQVFFCPYYNFSWLNIWVLMANFPSLFRFSELYAWLLHLPCLKTLFTKCLVLVKSWGVSLFSPCASWLFLHQYLCNFSASFAILQNLKASLR